MLIVIFFGGILAGFLLGFSSMALLSVMNYRLQCQQMQKVAVHRRIPASFEE
ncbi:MAG: hypothetical protein WC443_02675 [Desulfobaccales bacterium]